MGTEFSQVSLTTKWKKANPLAFHIGVGGIAGTVIIKNVKIERGNRATGWMPAPEDIETAIDAVQDTADGKNAVFYQATQPSTAGRKVNDLWFDTDDGNRMHTFNGTAWAPVQFGTNAIAQLAITNALIANGTIEDAKIVSVTAAKICLLYTSPSPRD